MNSLINQVVDLVVVMQVLQLDYFVESETKPAESFSVTQFLLHGYDIQDRKDRNKHGEV